MTFPQFTAGYRACRKCSAAFLQAIPADWASVNRAGGWTDR